MSAPPSPVASVDQSPPRFSTTVQAIDEFTGTKSTEAIQEQQPCMDDTKNNRIEDVLTIDEDTKPESTKAI